MKEIGDLTMRTTIGKFAITTAFGFALTLTFSCSFCNTDGNAACNPVPSYFPESECTSTPDTSIECGTNNKYYSCR